LTFYDMKENFLRSK